MIRSPPRIQICGAECAAHAQTPLNPKANANVSDVIEVGVRRLRLRFLVDVQWMLVK